MPVLYIQTKLKYYVELAGNKQEKTVKTAMADIGFEPGDLDGIVVTHEHADHIKGIGVMMRRYNVPVYANSMTWSSNHELMI